MTHNRDEESVELQPLEQSQVLLYFNEVSIAEVVDTLAKATGIVESRRIEEHFDDEG